MLSSVTLFLCTTHDSIVLADKLSRRAMTVAASMLCKGGDGGCLNFPRGPFSLVWEHIAHLVGIADAVGYTTQQQRILRGKQHYRLKRTVVTCVAQLGNTHSQGH